MNEKLEKNENKKTADVLRAENLVRDYVQYGEDGEKKKEIHVLKGLNFSIQRQEFVGIMGRSGCGKTTLLKLLGMIDRQTGGKLFFEEHDTEDLWIRVPGLLFDGQSVRQGKYHASEDPG